MKNIRIEHEYLPSSVIQGLTQRDAALWIGNGVDASDEATESLAKLCSLPWKLVLCESTSARLVNQLEQTDTSAGALQRKRGFVHVVASDPEGTQLPPRALPIFLLNGRTNPRDPAESTTLGAFGTMRRRLNMMNELVAARPRIVVMVSAGADQPLTDFLVLWRQENFRCLVVLLSSTPFDAQRVDSWLTETDAAPAVDHSTAPLTLVVTRLVEQLSVDLPEDRLLVRVRSKDGALADLDVTECELIERPLLDGYELIQPSNLRLIQPDELSREEFESFFTGSTTTWKPYAAGLPWRRGGEAGSAVLKALQAVASGGPTENCLLSIISESGAGGTTCARVLAFHAASEGFPTFLARPGFAEPDVLELSRFLYRVHLKANQVTNVDVTTSDAHVAAVPAAESFETPSLIVFDVDHWEGRQSELHTFLTGLKEDGRPVVILAVNSPFVPVDLRSDRVRRIANLTHELSLDDALALGSHLNKYLRPFGKERAPHEWRRFWEAHRPEYLTTSFAHFWIALEFWLKGQLDLNQSIQSWLYDSFTSFDAQDDLRLLLLEIAALSVERQPLPEGLMPLSSTHRRPFSVLLEDVRTNVPALALVRETVGVNKVWAMAHDLLGRYLINSTFFDRSMLERLGLTAATDPVHLRLLLLRRIACRTAMSLKPFRKLATDFALKILKLDAEGNPEFIPHWKDVLEILAAMPAGIRETSRTFNHHVAISLRRVAKQREFGVSIEDRTTLLEKAIGHLEYAAYQLPRTDDDESNLNLFNSLALAYQDAADVQREAGAAKEVIEGYRLKATEATLKALQEDPTNSYVLETTAKNLIQNGELHPDAAAASAAEALGYLYQAVGLERSEFRQAELARLANRALQLLRIGGGHKQVEQLKRAGNPLGTLAEAWLLLTEGVTDLNEYDLSAMPAANVRAAFERLEASPEKANWMLLRFRYDLLCASRPGELPGQLRLLDELEGTGYRMPLQLQLEHAILLHQEKRHLEANRKFRDLRQDYRRSDAFVEVPARLFWLRSGADGDRLVCEARVVESRGHRAMAKVRELKEEMVPFIPQEFGVQTLRAGSAFKCWVNFGRQGPFLKPPQSTGRNA